MGVCFQMETLTHYHHFMPLKLFERGLLKVSPRLDIIKGWKEPKTQKNTFHSRKEKSSQRKKEGILCLQRRPF